MTQEKVNMFIMQYGKYFPAESLYLIKKRLLVLNDEISSVLFSADFKDSTTLTIISLLCGGLGIDRFMLGDTGMGVLKLLTSGVCGILTIIDWFTIGKKTKEYNYAKFMQLTSYYVRIKY